MLLAVHVNFTVSSNVTQCNLVDKHAVFGGTDFASVLNNLFLYSHNSSVGITTQYGAVPPVLDSLKDFSLFHSDQTGSGARPVPYPMGSGHSCPWG
jgi:hypothetical protein